MHKVVVVSGTPGTGKTWLAGRLAAKFHARYVDVNALIRKERLCGGYDRSLQTYGVDAEKVVGRLIKLIRESSESLVIDSHLGQYLPRRYVDVCYVTVCSLPVLKRRLVRRGYSERKVRENLDAEIFEVCLFEAVRQRFKSLVVVDTTSGKPKYVRVR